MLTVRSKELRRSVNKLGNEVRRHNHAPPTQYPTQQTQNDQHTNNNQLLEPYQSTELRTHQLRRIHAAHDLLKNVARFSATLARLRKGPLQGAVKDSEAGTAGAGLVGAGALGALDPRELARAAGYLQELEALVQVRV